MGLTGNLTNYTYSEHETETETIEVTYPNEPENFGELAGTSVTEEFPLQVETATVQENVYVMIQWVTFYKMQVNADGDYLLDFGYKIYDSKADRDTNIHSWIDEGDVLGQHTAITSTEDLRVKAYEVLRAKRGFENLTND
jgi:hypothetical protein